MSALTRRAIFGATVAVAAIAAPVATTAAPSADTELFRLIDKLADVRTRLVSADEFWWSRVSEFDKAKGEEPEVLKKRRHSDWMAGLPVLVHEGGHFNIHDLPECRAALAKNVKLVSDSNGIFNVQSRDRCLEVINAIEAREAHLDTLRQRLGVDDASDKMDAIVAEEEALITAIQAYRPKTVEGLKRKSELAGSWEFGDTLCETETVWARSLLADIKSMREAA